MMYTSQEGEIYGGQARASGAVGVLPKSIRPIDVTKALYQLQLLPDRRDDEPSALESVGGEARRESAQAPSYPCPSRPCSRSRISSSGDSSSRRSTAWTHRIVADLRPKISAEEAEAEAVGVEAPPPSRPWPWILATASALIAFLVVAILYWQARVATEQAERAFEAVAASNETLTQAIEKWRIAGEASADAAGQEGFRPMVLAIPFGEQALNPARLESIRTLVAQLERAAISGVVRIESFAGSFCLASAGDDGYTLAAPTSPAAQCEQIGNPFDETRGSASRQPLGIRESRGVGAAAHRRRDRARTRAGAA